MKNKALFIIVALIGIVGGTALITQAASAHWFGLGGDLEATAKDLGLSATDLKTKLETQSIGEIASGQGQTLGELKSKSEERQLENLKSQGYTDEEINILDQARDIQQSKMLENKAEFLGISTDQLNEKLQTKTFHELLGEYNKSSDEFRQFMQDKGFGRLGHKGFRHNMFNN